MSDSVETIVLKERKGSRERCLLLTHGPGKGVAHRLTELAVGHAVVVPAQHAWAPRGLEDRGEPELGKTAPFLSPEARQAVSNWWLAVRPETARTPNWDIVSQATIGGREGLILLEAKAHVGELRGEEGRKRLEADASADSLTNHRRIGACIDEASAALRLATSVPWQLSRDVRYQMSNRFAWAWKMAELGIPVVLVYLGFLNATEMRGAIPDHAVWEREVKSHGEAIVPDGVWGRVWDVNGVPLIPLIRSLELPLPHSAGAVDT